MGLRNIILSIKFLIAVCVLLLLLIVSTEAIAISLCINDSSLGCALEAIDSDQDGYDDCDDGDDDNDGIPDDEENNPAFSPENQCSSYDGYDNSLIDAGDIDTDCDGIPNRLDLDSDNDGIYDVVEAKFAKSQSIIFTDGAIVENIGVYGINTFIAPTQSPSGFYFLNGAYDIMSTQGIVDAYTIDSDGDGCFDVREAGFRDGDNNGQLGKGYVFGSGPDYITVDGMGRVNIVPTAYTTPNDFNNDGLYDFLEYGDAPTETIALPNGPLTTCAGNQIDLNISFESGPETAYVYKWFFYSEEGGEWKHINESEINGFSYSDFTTSTLEVATPADLSQPIEIKYVARVYNGDYVCGGIETGEVWVKYIPIPSATLAVLGGDNDLCVGESAGLVISGSNPWTLFYTQDGVDRDLNLSVVDAPVGEFHLNKLFTLGFDATDVGNLSFLTIRDAYNCIAVVNGNVDLTINPIPEISESSSSICLGDPVTFYFSGEGNYPFTFNYLNSVGSPSSGSHTVNANSHTYNSIPAGTHYITRLEDKNGCVNTSYNTAPIEVEVNTGPTIEIISELDGCVNEDFEVEMTGDPNPYWLVTVLRPTGATSGTLLSTSPNTIETDSEEGVFTITNIEDDTGCEGTIIGNATYSTVAIDPPTSQGNQSICIGESIPPLVVTVNVGEAVDWYDSATDGVLLSSNSTAYVSSDSSSGTQTYHAQARNTSNGCESADRTAVSLTINELPTLSAGAVTCAGDNLTYSVVYTSNGDVITSNHGTVYMPNNKVVGIPIANDVQITATTNGCSTMIEEVPPTCACLNVDAAVSLGNKNICSGESIPPLVVTVNTGEAVDWYDSAVGGTLLLANSSAYVSMNASSGTQTYHAQARNTSNGCESADRTAVSLTINELPTLSAGAVTCAGDNLTYSVVYTSNGDVITSNYGTVYMPNNKVVGIPIANDVQITATTNGCSTMIEEVPPTCACLNVDAAVSLGNKNICSGESIPPLVVTVNTGEAVDWYDSAVGGTLLLANSSAYVSMNASSGTQTYHAQARNTSNGCESADRTAVSLTINELPTLSAGAVTCAGDNLTYSVVYTSNGDVITSNHGTVYMPNNKVVGIPIANDVQITATTNGCSTMIEEVPPTCACLNVDAAVSLGNKNICSGESIPPLVVTVNTGEAVDWYDSAVGGTLLLANSSAYVSMNASSGTQTYHAQARNTSNGCESADRTAVSLTINELPTLSAGAVTCAGDNLTYSVVYTSNGDVITSNHGTVYMPNNKVVGIPIANDVQITATTNGCSTMIEEVPPTCACPDVDAAVSLGNKNICSGESIPPLVVTVNTGEAVDWYDSAVGGTLLLANSSAYVSMNASSGTQTYHAQARNTSNGCESADRTAVSLTINELPTLSAGAVTCAGDNLTYSVVYTSNGDVITSNHGTVYMPNNKVVGIPIANDVQITATTNGCIQEITVDPPVCDCLAVALISGGALLCPSDSIDILVEFEGFGPWQFEFTHDGVFQGAVITNDNPYLLNVSSPGVYELVSVSGGGCYGSVSGQAVVGSVGIPEIINEVIVCTDDQMGYFVSFDIVGGDPSSYLVNGITNVSTNHFISEVIPVDEEYYFEVTDANGCDSDILQGIYSCGCLATAKIVGDTTICSGGQGNLFVNFEGEGPWTFQYAIGGQEQEIIQTNNNPYLINSSAEGIYSLVSMSDINCIGTVSGEGVIRILASATPDGGLDQTIEQEDGGVVTVTFIADQHFDDVDYTTYWEYNDEEYGYGQQSTSINLSEDFQHQILYVVESICGIEKDTVIVNSTSVVMPKIITPNGDGTNELFQIKGINLDNQTNNSLKIVSSTGRVIFDQEGYKNDWGGFGKTNKLLSIGTYYYFFSITTESKNQINRTGSFELTY